MLNQTPYVDSVIQPGDRIDVGGAHIEFLVKGDDEPELETLDSAPLEAQSQDRERLNSRIAELERQEKELVGQQDRLRDQHQAELDELKISLQTQFEDRVNAQRQELETDKEAARESNQALKAEIEQRDHRIAQLEDELAEQIERYEKQQNDLVTRINEAVAASEERLEAAAQIEQRQMLDAFEREKEAILEEKQSAQDEFRSREAEWGRQNDQLCQHVSHLEDQLARLEKETDRTGESPLGDLPDAAKLEEQFPEHLQTNHAASDDSDHDVPEDRTMCFAPGEIDALLKRRGTPSDDPTGASDQSSFDDELIERTKPKGLEDVSSTRIIAPSLLSDPSQFELTDPAESTDSVESVSDSAERWSEPLASSSPEIGEEADSGVFSSGDEVREDEPLPEPPSPDTAPASFENKLHNPESNAANDEADEEMDEIQAYMRRLLNRSELDGADLSQRYTSQKNSFQSPVSVQPPKKPKRKQSQTSSETNAEPDGEFVPRSMAPELKADLTALRELANQSAKQAISVSSRAQARNVFLSNLVTAFVIGSCGCMAWTFSPSMMSVVWFSGSAAIGFALYLTFKAFAKAGLILVGKSEVPRGNPRSLTL